MSRGRNAFGISLGSLVLGLATVAPVSAAPLVNGSFEDFPDFNGWVTVGNTSVQSSDTKTPIDGDAQALLSSGVSAIPGSAPASMDIAGLDGFFNLSAGMLEGYHAKSGSGAKQTFTGQVNGQVTFAFNFATNEGSNPDFAFYTLTLPGGGTIFVPFGNSGLASTSPYDDLSGYFFKENRLPKRRGEFAA